MPKGMGVLSKFSQAIWLKIFPGPGGVMTAPGQLVVGGFPCTFLSLGLVSHVSSQRENSMRTLGYLQREMECTK